MTRNHFHVRNVVRVLLERKPWIITWESTTVQAIQVCTGSRQLSTSRTVWTDFAMLFGRINIRVCTGFEQLFTSRTCLLVILIFKFELDLNNYSHQRHFKACIEASQSGRLMFRNSFNPRFPKYDEKVQNNQFKLDILISNTMQEENNPGIIWPLPTFCHIFFR